VSDRDQRSALAGARDAEPRADAAPVLGQALQDQIGQALQPAMAELREQITASVRREIDQQLHDDGRRSPRQESSRQSMSRLDDHEDEDEGSDAAHGGPRSRPAEQNSEAAPRESSELDASDHGISDETAEPRASAGPELGLALQEQINQALQPAIAEFREQMAATVRRELDETLHRDRRQAPADAGRATNRGHGDEQASSDRGTDQSADEARSKGSDPSGGRGGQAIRPLLGKPLREALPQILEQQGEHWLRSRLDLGIDVVFSGWVRAAVQHEAERVFQRVARVAIELVPDRASREDLRAQSEQTVESLVRTALDKLFADDVREDLKSRGHQAIGALFQPDLKSVLRQVQDLLQSLLDGLLAVLRECWEQILQFVARVVMALVQSRLTAVLKDTFASLVTTPGREGDKKGTESATAIEQEEEPHQTLNEPAEAGRDDGARRLAEPPRRARESEGAADSYGDGADQRPGRAPSGRPPAGRPPTTRQTSGRPFSDRSTSGRPSRAGSR